ncbi:MAG: flagellar brake protein [Candidatus Aquicultor sp.]
MENFQIALNTGQVINLSDSRGVTWRLGVKHHLADNRVLCELLDLDINPPDKAASDLKLSVPHDAGVYVIATRIAEVSRDGREYKFLLNKEYQLVQRRGYYRLSDPHLRIQCRIYGETVEDVTVIDVGGGGAALAIHWGHPVKLKEDLPVGLDITLPEGDKIKAHGKTLRVSESNDKSGYQIGITFTKLDRADRAKLIKFIFDEQLLRNKEGGLEL